MVFFDRRQPMGSVTQSYLRSNSVIFTKFQTKDMGPLLHFIGIEIAKSVKEISLYQRKNVLDMLSKASMLKIADAPINPNLKLSDQRSSLRERFMRLIRKLNYFTVPVYRPVYRF